VAFLGVLNACASVVALEEARCAHEQIIQGGCEPTFVVNIVIDYVPKALTQPLAHAKNGGQQFWKPKIHVANA
jgi:hypothetical protein